MGDGAVVVALDAMGGDQAPEAIVAGAVRARRDHGVDSVLVGAEPRLAEILGALGARGELPVVAASQVIAMDEDPALAVRAKPESSVRVAAGLVAAGEASAMLSAGSTGATLAAGLLALGRSEGVRRPAVGAVLPLAERAVVLVDAGATSEAAAELLVTYAVMGAAYARVLGAASPRVGLLNVGTEAGKGSALAKEAFALLSADPPPCPGFVGNVEPGDVLTGTVDVVVTDGFTGNVFLKTVEATLPPGSAHAGAALLLGVRGEVLVAHGAAGEHEIAAALQTAASVAAAGLSRAVARGVAELRGG